MKTLKLCMLAAAASVAIAAPASAETVLTVSSWASPKHTMNKDVFPWMNEQLKACSNGDLSLKIEYGLAPPPAQYDTVRDGVGDLSWIVHGYTPGKFVTTKLAELPGIPGTAEAISVAYQMTQEKYLAAAKEAKGVQVLTNFVHGPGMVNTVEPINSYADLKGKKMRVGGGVANAIGKALGVAGVNVPAPAVYETIASGVAEGVFFPAETLFAFKTAELTKFSYRNPDGMYTTSFGLIMNNDRYNGLSDANRGCIDKMRGVELARKVGSFWDAADAFGIEQATKNNGLKIVDVSDAERALYKDATKHIEAEVVAEVDGRGVDGKAALAFMKEQLK